VTQSKKYSLQTPERTGVAEFNDEGWRGGTLSFQTRKGYCSQEENIFKVTAVLTAQYSN